MIWNDIYIILRVFFSYHVTLKAFVGLTWRCTVCDWTVQLLFEVTHCFLDLINDKKTQINRLVLLHCYWEFWMGPFHSVLLRTCSRLLLYLCLYDTLWLSCPSSCSTVRFNSSQWPLICVSFAWICAASPGVTNLDRALQSASMRASAAFLSSKPPSTVCRDARAKDWQSGKCMLKRLRLFIHVI